MTKKIAISLPAVTLGKARAAVKDRRASSLSSYIGRLIEDASATETFEEMLAAWIQESGATSAEVRAAQKESLEAFERAGLMRSGSRREKGARKTG
jgi:Arc/MetJ-type ribon-helix-helix transcriptional regulator